jgi:hypothetical protein
MRIFEGLMSSTARRSSDLVPTRRHRPMTATRSTQPLRQVMPPIRSLPETRPEGSEGWIPVLRPDPLERRGCADCRPSRPHPGTGRFDPKPPFRAEGPNGSLRSDNAELGDTLVRKLQGDLLDAGRAFTRRPPQSVPATGFIAQPRRFGNDAICHCQRCLNGRSCL